ncbi:MAG: hypothetical protein AAFN09_15430 [Pseudomonadota bacterium]
MLHRPDNKAREVARRPAHQVMTLPRLGAFHQTRLSFMRVLLRRLIAENWRFEVTTFDIDASGVGHAVYTMHGPERSYSLIAFAHDLPDDQRSDRVIATAWDATFTLFDGLPSPSDVARLSAQVPVQEQGRVSQSELSLSRANRSTRLWDYVLECLAAGTQPDAQRLDEVGYLMRTTAVYGSGKFGAADRASLEQRPEFREPFQVEMLNVYLIRCFVVDLVEHMARARAPERAVALAPDLRRRLGIGNSTGLGMAPFLLNHQVLINNWIAAREEALARIRTLPAAKDGDWAKLSQLAERLTISVNAQRPDDPRQAAKLAELRKDLQKLAARLETRSDVARPWDNLWHWAEGVLGLEGQESLLTLLLELRPDLVDQLAVDMSADESAMARIDGRMSMSALRRLIENRYAWALKIDWSDAAEQARLWYVSAAKSEPRLGDRADADLANFEQALAPGRDAAQLYRETEACEAENVGQYLMERPKHRHIVRRIQIAACLPYGEIESNTVSAQMVPIDLLRAKLSFFGATAFDPRSDRWLRINMFQNAPFPVEWPNRDWDDWVYPQARA